MRSMPAILFIAAATIGLPACSVITGISNACNENPADGTRICTSVDTSQNITTRTIERDHKLFVSTCSNGNCSEYKEIAGAPAASTTGR